MKAADGIGIGPTPCPSHALDTHGRGDDKWGDFTEGSPADVATIGLWVAISLRLKAGNAWHGEGRCRPFRAWDLLDVNPGRRSQTRFTPGYHISGFQPWEARGNLRERAAARPYQRFDR